MNDLVSNQVTLARRRQARRRGGSSYHLSFRSGSRGRRFVRRTPAHEYITRRRGVRRTTDRDAGDLHASPTTCPRGWRTTRARTWDAADLYERANGRLVRQRGLSAATRPGRSRTRSPSLTKFAQRLTSDECFPYTLAIHSGRNANGQEHNPHAHLMIPSGRGRGTGEQRRAAQHPQARADLARPGRAHRRRGATLAGPGGLPVLAGRGVPVGTGFGLRPGGGVDSRRRIRAGHEATCGRNRGPAFTRGVH